MSRNIAIDLRMIHSSGIGTVLSNVVPLILEQRPNWNFRLLGDPKVIEDYQWSKSGRIEIIEYRAPIYSIAEQLYWPNRKLKGTDIVWSPNYNIPWRWSGKIMVNVHDIAHFALPEIYGGVAKTFYAKTMFKYVQKRADGIVFVSRFSEEEFEKKIGTAKGYTSVVHNGVKEYSAIQGENRLTYKNPYILFVGNIKPHKNIKKLIEAFELIYDKINVDLVIVGKKEGFITGDNEVAEFVGKAKDRVVFTGFVENDQLKHLYTNAEALVLPSLYEGFGLPPIEAMTAGCPALVSNVASMPEICGDAALYFDPLDASSIADALQKILSDDALKKRLVKNGYQRIKLLTWSASAKGYLAMIEKIIGCP